MADARVRLQLYDHHRQSPQLDLIPLMEGIEHKHNIWVRLNVG
jgi:hypothetical protein